MSVRIRINGRDFTLNWSEFEKYVSNMPLSDSYEILSIRGGRYVAA